MCASSFSAALKSDRLLAGDDPDRVNRVSTVGTDDEPVALDLDRVAWGRGQLQATGKVSGHRHEVTLGTMAKADVFEASDGSSFTAMPGPPGVPVKGAEEWRLFNGKGAGKGIFGDLSHVLRFDTKGGLPPGDLPAETGAQQTVPFAATYVFYAPALNGR